MRKLFIATAFLGLLLLSASAQQPLTFSIAPPADSIPLTQSTTGTTGSISVTLAGAANKYTYICGFTVTSGGTTTALAGNVTITGTVGGTQNFTYVFVSSGQGLLGINFAPGCITSSAQNTSIVMTVPAGGTGTTVAATIWGYRV